MLIPNKFNGYSRDGRREYYFGSGSSGPTSSTVTQSNIPDYLRPQVEQLLGGATKELFGTEQQIDPATGLGRVDADGNPVYDITGTKPFTPYSADPRDYVAGFSPLQQQVQANAANLQVPGQFNQATGFANAAGRGGLESAQQALGYGNAGFNAGQQGQQSGLLGQQLGIRGGQFYGAQGAGYGAGAAGLVDRAQDYGESGFGYGREAASLADTALDYGNLASLIGQMGLDAESTGSDITTLSKGYAADQALAGSDFFKGIKDPEQLKSLMDPYRQNVIDLQLDAAQRQADIARTKRGSQAARAGAFGGARQAIENAEADRALASQFASIQALGDQAAYDKAVQAMQYGSNLGLQGLSGAQSGLGTALQGGQLGLSGIGQALAGQQAAMQGVGQAGSMYGLGMQGSQSGLAGLQAANQLYGTGIQGANLGLQGVDRQMAGTAQGMQGAQSAMQGAQSGLQGVSGAQAGYGLANQTASNLSNIGTAQLGAQTGILGLQNQIGGQQQAQEQQVINQAIQNFANAQQQPLQNLNQFNALLRGYALPGTTTTQYQAEASPLNQLTGAGATLLAANNLTKGAAGGRPKDFKRVKRSGLHTLALRNALRG